MKRIVSFLLILSLAAGLFGCAADRSAPERPVNFYYCRTQLTYNDATGVIAPEQRESKDHPEDYAGLLGVYLKGPLDPAFENPFPRNLSVLDLSCSNGIVSVTLSDALGELAGLELTIACACLARTCLELTGCDTIRISAEGLRLGSGGYLQLRQEDLLLADDSVEQLQDSMVLYLTDAERTCLIGKTVTVNLASGNGACAVLLEQLIQGLPGEALYSPLPEGTRLLGVSVEDGICAVNFSAEFEQEFGSDTSRQSLALQSIANTLTQLSSVSGVLFYCEGTRLLHCGALDTRDPWVWDDISLWADPSDGATPATLYVYSGTDEGLVGIPVRLEADGTTAAPDQIVNALLEFQSSNGYLCPTPSGTELVRTMVSDNLCVISLSEAFLAGGTQMEPATRAIIASVCSLPEIDSARIVINGLIPAGDYGELFSISAPQPDWFA